MTGPRNAHDYLSYPTLLDFWFMLIGTQIHAMALHPDKRLILLRSAGSYGTVMGHDEKGMYTHVRLQSGEVRKVLQVCLL